MIRLLQIGRVALHLIMFSPTIIACILEIIGGYKETADTLGWIGLASLFTFCLGQTDEFLRVQKEIEVNRGTVLDTSIPLDDRITKLNNSDLFKRVGIEAKGVTIDASRMKIF